MESKRLADEISPVLAGQVSRMVPRKAVGLEEIKGLSGVGRMEGESPANTTNSK